MAQSAEKALVILEKEEFPATVLDIMLPGISGIDLLKKIREKHPDTHSIMLTANMTAENVLLSLNVGAFAYLLKPIQLEELRTTLKNACSQYFLRRENNKLIEELRRARDFSDAIIKNLALTVVATDTKGMIKKVSKYMENMLGYREHELLDRPLQVIFTEEFRKNSWTELIREGKAINFPVDFLTKDNQTKTLYFNGLMMIDAKEKVIGFLGTASEKPV